MDASERSWVAQLVTTRQQLLSLRLGMVGERTSRDGLSRTSCTRIDRLVMAHSTLRCTPGTPPYQRWAGSQGSNPHRWSAGWRCALADALSLPSPRHGQDTPPPLLSSRDIGAGLTVLNHLPLPSSSTGPHGPWLPCSSSGSRSCRSTVGRGGAARLPSRVLYCTIHQVSFFLVPATCRAHTPPIYQLVHFFLLAVSYLLLGSRILGASGPRPPSPRASNSLLHLSRLESFSRGERSWGLCKTGVFGSLNRPASRISLYLALGCPLQKRGPILDRHLYYNTPPRPSLPP